jgi:Ras-related protein Rab-11A
MFLRHYRRALGAIVVYDITKERTFTNVKRWIEAIREQADPNVVIVLVGNKIDLRDCQVVSTGEAKKWAKS